jgi:nicotinamide-nucleotide amidase
MVRPLAAALVERARAAGVQIAVAESCTGGMIAVALTDVAGASRVFDRGFVTYSNAAKQALLGVRPETLAAHGAVSEAVAREMAEGALAASKADLAVSVTGIAGPGGSEHKPEGRVCFGLCKELDVTTDTVDFGFVTYSNAAKMDLLGVRAETLEAVGAVSEEVAAEMAEGARRRAGADIAVSVTGIAGPGGSEVKPEGRVCFGLATEAGTRTETVDFGALGRAEVRRATVRHALERVLDAVKAA